MSALITQPPLVQQLSRVDRAMAYPPFTRQLLALLTEALEVHQHAYWVVELHRSYERSDELFAHGRTTPGPIVTRARAGQSAHNFGIAADLCLDGYVDRAGLQPDWRPESYELLRTLAPKHGLVWGGTFKGLADFPHVQLPGFVDAGELQPLRKLFDAGGLQACWGYLDSLTPKETV